MAKKNLLLVDADSKSLRMLEVSLRKSGFSVTTAISAGDAREKVRHSQPDLIITDTKLPGDENGFELVANLKAAPETQAIPIIFLSSENKLEQKVTGLELGVEDYLTKPIYIREVLTRVRVLLEKREKEKLERRERSSSFSGSLGEMGLVDLMQTVEIGRKTGRLDVETRGQKGTISFREGKVCDARTGRLSGERAFYRMLVWNDGVFSMEFGAHDAADVIELSTQGLLMEGMRRVDEWGRLLEQLPPLDRVFEIDFGELVDRLAEIPDEINAILRLFDGRRRLIDVVDESDFGDLEALEIASKLFFEGLIYDVTDRPAEENEPAPQQVQKIEQWLDAAAGNEPLIGPGEDDLSDARLEPTQPPGPALEEEIRAPASASPSPSPSPSPLAALPSSPPIASVSVTPMAASEPSRAPGFLAGTGVPVTGTPAAPIPLPASRPSEPVARPLPRPDAEVPEPRSVAPRAAVGATAWSSPPKSRGDDDAWEDVVASGLDDDDLGLSELQGKGEITKPQRAALPRTATPTLGSLPLPPPGLPPPGASAGPHELPAPPPDDIDLGAQIAAALPPELTSETASSFEDEPVPAQRTTPNERSLPARPADTIPDRAASAVGAAPSQPPTSSQAPGTVVDVVQASAPYTSTPPTSVPAAADGDAPTRPSMPALSLRSLPDESSPSPSLPPQATTESDKPAPISSTTPSASGNGSGNGSASPSPPPAPMTELPAVERIHTQRTAIDIEPPPSAWGTSPMVAGALVGIAIVLGAGLALFFSGDEEELVGADAGPVFAVRDPIVAPDPINTPDPIDAARPDAGVVAAVADAGVRAEVGVRATVGIPAAADAGQAAAVVVAAKPDAGPAVVVDAPPRTPEQEYAERMKSGEAFSRRGEFNKAIREYKAALALKAGSLQANLGLGNAYYEIDNIDAALIHLEKARALSPKDPQAYVLLGAVYQSSGRKDDAVEAYKRYLELAPEGKFSRDVRGILKGMGAI